MGGTHALCLQTSPREQAQNCVQINALHSAVALRSKLDFKFLRKDNEETICPSLLHSQGRTLQKCSLWRNKEEQMYKICTCRLNLILFVYD